MELWSVPGLILGLFAIAVVVGGLIATINSTRVKQTAELWKNNAEAHEAEVHLRDTQVNRLQAEHQQCHDRLTRAEASIETLTKAASGEAAAVAMVALTTAITEQHLAVADKLNQLIVLAGGTPRTT